MNANNRGSRGDEALTLFRQATCARGKIEPPHLGCHELEEGRA